MAPALIREAMASLSGEGTPGLSVKNGCKVFSDQAFTVENVLLAMGEVVGHENIVSASRMNKAVVVFCKDEKLVNSLVEKGIVVSDTLLQVMPLRAPATKVTISNAPPFIPNEQILKELSRFGKFAGSIKMVPLGCKNAALKHVLSFRRQVFMFLNAQTEFLDISFRIQHGDSSYMIFATTDSLRCFECGDLGHKKLTCPHKKQTESGKNARNNDERIDRSENNDNLDKEKRPISVKDVIQENKQKTNEVIDEDSGALASAGEPSVIPQASSSAEQSAIDPSSKSEVSEFTSSMRAGDNAVGPNVSKDAVVALEDNEHDCGDVVPSVSGSQLKASVEIENSDEELMEDCDNCSEFSEIDCSQMLDDVYSVEELNEFLDLTKGKKVDVVNFFPDVNKFIKSVVIAQKTVGYDVISKQKRFRLRKLLTTVRKAQKGQVKLLKWKK